MANLVAFFLVLTTVHSTWALLEGIYCGTQNCYDVLGVTRDSTKSEISKNYRNLAKKYHPDTQREQEAKDKAAEQFRLIATAYEVLKDEGSRTDYDYMLDNPDEYYANYYRYYRRRVAPQVDVRLVIFVTISIVSVIQYYTRWQNYEHAIKSIMTVPKYKNQALHIAKEEGLLPNERKVKDKTFLLQEKDRIIKKIIEEKMDIKGSYAKPLITEILWLRILMFPYTLTMFFYWYLSWYFRHSILKQEYSDEEKLYIIRRYLNMNEAKFEAQWTDHKEEFLQKELWLREKFDVWFQERKEEEKKKLAENNRYKQFRRYMKTHGVGRMTFDDS